ncbi:VAMP-like protein YKT61 [Tanacetum coccineum]
MDDHYPVRSAFSVLNQVIDEYQKKHGDSWKTVQADKTDQWPYLNDALARFQNPAEADKLLKIQRELDETKIILVSINSCYSRTLSFFSGDRGDKAKHLCIITVIWIIYADRWDYMDESLPVRKAFSVLNQENTLVSARDVFEGGCELHPRRGEQGGELEGDERGRHGAVRGNRGRYLVTERLSASSVAEREWDDERRQEDAREEEHGYWRHTDAVEGGQSWLHMRRVTG